MSLHESTSDSPVVGGFPEITLHESASDSSIVVGVCRGSSHKLGISHILEQVSFKLTEKKANRRTSRKWGKTGFKMIGESHNKKLDTLYLQIFSSFKV